MTVAAKVYSEGSPPISIPGSGIGGMASGRSAIAHLLWLCSLVWVAWLGLRGEPPGVIVLAVSAIVLSTFLGTLVVFSKRWRSLAPKD